MTNINDSFKDAVLRNCGKVSIWKSILTNPETAKNFLSDLPFLHYVFDCIGVINFYSQASSIKNMRDFFWK